MSKAGMRFRNNKGKFRLEEIWANADEIGGAIRKMEKNYPSLKEKLFVITEGPYDYEFYSRFFNRETCEIRFANSKKNVIRIIDNLLGEIPDEKQESFIGIVDRDFSFFYENCRNDPANIFMTDSHDLETMIISEKIIERVLNRYEKSSVGGNFQRKANVGIRDGNLLRRLIECSRLIGLSLYINEKYGFNMIFKHINCKKKNVFLEFTEPSSLSINEKKLMEFICRRNPTKSKDFMAAFSEEMSEKKEYFDHPMQICRGHDLMCVLLSEININYPQKNGKNVVLGDLERLCLELYEEEDFYKTDLYGNIKAWVDMQKKGTEKSFFKTEDI